MNESEANEQWKHLLWVAIMAFAASAQGVLAQSTSSLVDSSESTTLETIIVTAQKRSQSIDDVPMSITAVTGADLLQQGITNTADLEKIVPGFTANLSYLSTPVYTLRGIGLYDTAIASQSPVAVYVDQNPLPYPVMTAGAALDVERVEVLKGPQGILFGQNTTGGAINYVANKPTSTFSAGGDITYERFNKTDINGFVSGPISDTMQARIAVRAIGGGAWQESATRPDDTLGDQRQFQGRILLDWQPTDRLKLAFNINGNVNHSDTQAYQLEKVQPTVSASAYPPLYSAILTIDGGNPQLADWVSGTQRMGDSFYQFAGRADYGVSDAITLTDLTSFASQNINHLDGQGGTPFLLFYDDDFGHVDAFNEEFRVAYDIARMHWVAGANYEYDQATDTRYVTYEHLSTDQPIPSIPPFQHTANTTGQAADTYAVFGNMEYSFENRITMHGGLRYTVSDRHGHSCGYNGDSTNITGQIFETLEEILIGAGVKKTPFVPITAADCFPLTPAPDLSPALTGTDESLSEHNLSWRIGLQYKTEADALLYANASRGFKAGVISNVGGSSTIENVPAKQEKVDAYEVGIKTPLFGRSVHLDASAFFYNYTDKQVRGRFLDPIFGLLDTLLNVPKSRVWGIEEDLQLRPLTGLTFDISSLYLNTKVTSAFNSINQQGATGNFEGSRLPFSPTFSAVGSAQYEWPVKEGLDAFVGTSTTYRTRDNVTFQTATLNADEFRLPPYGLLDVRAGVLNPDGKWRLTFYAHNVTNKYYWNFVYYPSDTFLRRAGMPMTYGATLSLRF